MKRKWTGVKLSVEHVQEAAEDHCHALLERYVFWFGLVDTIVYLPSMVTADHCWHLSSSRKETKVFLSCAQHRMHVLTFWQRCQVSGWRLLAVNTSSNYPWVLLLSPQLKFLSSLSLQSFIPLPKAELCYLYPSEQKIQESSIFALMKSLNG